MKWIAPPLCGHYDAEWDLRRILVAVASDEMDRTAVLRTLRHEMVPTTCSGCQSVRANKCFWPIGWNGMLLFVYFYGLIWEYI